MVDYNYQQNMDDQSQQSGDRILHLLKGKVINEKYQVGDMIQQGGYGKVFFGNISGKNIPIAIKVIDLSKVNNQNTLQRIKREEKVLQKFQGDRSVVQCLDSFQDQEEKIKIIVMEYCPIQSLKDYLIFRGYIWEHQAIAILKQILICVARLHSNYIWHRDIKPQNFFGDFKNFKIGDFGEVKLLEGNKGEDWAKTKTQQATIGVGTIIFNPPQMLRGQSYSFKVDLYSVFITFYEILTGVPPFYIKNHVSKEQIVKHIQQNFEQIYNQQYIKKNAIAYGRDRFNCKLSEQSKEIMKKFITTKQKRSGWAEIFSSPYLNSQLNSSSFHLPFLQYRKKWQMTKLLIDILKDFSDHTQQKKLQKSMVFTKPTYSQNKSIQFVKSMKDEVQKQYFYSIYWAKIIYFQSQKAKHLRQTALTIKNIIRKNSSFINKILVASSNQKRSKQLMEKIQQYIKIKQSNVIRDGYNQLKKVVEYYQKFDNKNKQMQNIYKVWHQTQKSITFSQKQQNSEELKNVINSIIIGLDLKSLNQCMQRLLPNSGEDLETKQNIHYMMSQQKLKIILQRLYNPGEQGENNKFRKWRNLYQIHQFFKNKK